MSDDFFRGVVRAAQIPEERHQEIVGELRGLRDDIQALTRALVGLRAETETAVIVIKGWQARAEEIERERRAAEPPPSTPA